MDSKNNRIKIITVGAVIIAVAAIAAAGFFWMKWQAQSDPEETAQKEVATILDAAAKLIVLPEGETPTVATVKDPEKLKDQLFFANAKTGDKVLIYSQARKAILYRPSEDKIIEVAPLNIGD